MDASDGLPPTQSDYYSLFRRGKEREREREMAYHMEVKIVQFVKRHLEREEAWHMKVKIVHFVKRFLV